MITMTGVDELLERVEAYENSFDSRVRMFLTRLSDIGISIAMPKFSSTPYDGGDRGVAYSSEWVNDTTLQIVFSGSKVVFIEFGTGVEYPDHPQAYDFLAIHGEFGKGQGAYPPWRYVGEPGSNGKIVGYTKDQKPVVSTHGNPAAKAVYEAWNTMKERIEEIAKEVFYDG